MGGLVGECMYTVDDQWVRVRMNGGWVGGWVGGGYIHSFIGGWVGGWVGGGGWGLDTWVDAAALHSRKDFKELVKGGELEAGGGGHDEGVGVGLDSVLERWVGGWVGVGHGWVEENETVGMSCWALGLVGGWGEQVG